MATAIMKQKEVPEMAQLLGTTRSSVYAILDNPKYALYYYMQKRSKKQSYFFAIVFLAVFD